MARVPTIFTHGVCCDFCGRALPRDRAFPKCDRRTAHVHVCHLKKCNKRALDEVFAPGKA